MVLFDRILPPTVACAHFIGDDPDASVFPSEEAVIAHAVESRAREFRTARACAHRAMRTLGISPAPVLSGEHGEPLWPLGIVGSISHCRGYRVAALAKNDAVLALGVDVERYEALPGGTPGTVCTSREMDWLASAPAGFHWDVLFFGAKEAVFKAWFAQHPGWLDFEDIEIAFESRPQSFSATVRAKGCVAKEYAGRFAIEPPFVGTAVVVMGADQNRPGKPTWKADLESRPISASQTSDGHRVRR
ncbi:MAG: 4'-phosphopantetheinyl transferase superfamily protein [Alphaproteobacteria bacterium]|nr:4'-phosphopantetheinyl transferase superfamily protein [Alphaproteobacteria bacterium]